jgi:GT2 family glycosyltransferase
MRFKTSILIVNFNSSEFIEISLYALAKLTKNPYKVYLIDNGSKKKDYKNLLRICKKYPNISIERWETDLRGSLAHGTALNHLIKKVDTPYFSILDADATWLKKDWDETLIRKLKGNIKVIGTQAPQFKPQDFPLMFAILFETRTFKKINIDFRPKNIDLKQDTGYELKEKYLKAGYPGKVIDMKNTREFHKGPFRNLIVAEYYFTKKKEIFASHFGRGSTMGANKYLNTQQNLFYQIPIIGKLLLDYKGTKEKNEWIRICKKIIDEQTK